MPEPAHRKIVLQNSLLGGLYYADTYQFPRADGEPSPLVAYVGGSVSDAVFDQRLQTEPDVILSVYLKALEVSRRPHVDLFVLPFPAPRLTPVGQDGELPVAETCGGVVTLLETDWRTVLRRRFLNIFVTEILPARGLPLPSTLGIVGFSSGAYLAVGLALDLARAQSVAIMGGTGMAEAVKQCPKEACQGKRFTAYVNDEDNLRANAKFFEAFMRGRGIPVTTLTRPGRHSFADYAANGLAEEAFRFALGE